MSNLEFKIGPSSKTLEGTLVRKRAEKGVTHHPNSAKRSTFCHKLNQKLEFFSREVKGLRFKSSLLGPKGPYFRSSISPKLILAMGLANSAPIVKVGLHVVDTMTS